MLEERFVEIGGRRMRYLIGGHGRPLVLCHGFISSGEEFGGRFAALARHRTVIAPDLPGNGASAPLAGRHTAAAMASAVGQLLSELDVDTFDLGGLCLGATVACALARQRGDAVGQLVLHTPLLTPTLMRARFRHQVRLLTLPPWWEIVVWLSRRRLVSDLYKRHVIRETQGDPDTADVNFRNQQRADPRAAREWLRDGIAQDDVASLAGSTRPILIIVPARDLLVDVSQLRRLVERLPNIELFVDDEGAHGWSATAVNRHQDALSAFLTRFDVTPETPAGG